MREAVQATTPTGAYSPGIVAEGRFVFVSGQGPLRDGVVVSGTIKEETRLTLENVRAVLEAAGASLRDVVQCRVFLADINDFDAMNGVYSDFFPDPKPARTMVGVSLGDGIKVEIDAIAMCPGSASGQQANEEAGNE